MPGGGGIEATVTVTGGTVVWVEAGPVVTVVPGAGGAGVGPDWVLAVGRVSPIDSAGSMANEPRPSMPAASSSESRPAGGPSITATAASPPVVTMAIRATMVLTIPRRDIPPLSAAGEPTLRPFESDRRPTG